MDGAGRAPKFITGAANPLSRRCNQRIDRLTVVGHCRHSDGHTDAQSNRRANWLRLYMLTNTRRYRCRETLSAPN